MACRWVSFVLRHAATSRAEKVNMEVKLRNVSKAPVTITYGMLSESCRRSPIPRAER